eukprot:CAMPEP_0116848566 /NCGR_PEP_ID=MMETSP0418-20121206/15076_1 /TAXON_ID=1158023 /ORGANISM="Astrosyne radiata, Strain 13vi08-1A" /LENGTH=91 /DNA_ID=CAMNT_0004480167 /DNA_START=40 /DNA_END=315 /DNA_ORIENTATION=-
MTSIAIQDQSSRVTLICNWSAQVKYPNTDGILQVEILGDKETSLLEEETRRIRLIVEDVDHLRDVASEYAMSPFAKMHLQDFLDPVALFHP